MSENIGVWYKLEGGVILSMRKEGQRDMIEEGTVVGYVAEEAGQARDTPSSPQTYVGFTAVLENRMPTYPDLSTRTGLSRGLFFIILRYPALPFERQVEIAISMALYIGQYQQRPQC